MVTVEQLKELNNKINILKESNATAIAELNVLKNQLDEKAKGLSAILNINVTPDNIETLYNQAQAQLSEKAARIEELLTDLGGLTAKTNTQAEMFMQPGTPLTPTVSNFSTGTEFQI